MANDVAPEIEASKSNPPVISILAKAFVAPTTPENWTDPLPTASVKSLAVLSEFTVLLKVIFELVVVNVFAALNVVVPV